MQQFRQLAGRPASIVALNIQRCPWRNRVCCPRIKSLGSTMQHACQGLCLSNTPDPPAARIATGTATAWLWGGRLSPSAPTCPPPSGARCKPTSRCCLGSSWRRSWHSQTAWTWLAGRPRAAAIARGGAPAGRGAAQCAAGAGAAGLPTGAVGACPSRRATMAKCR